jgi:hypothetical protein
MTGECADEGGEKREPHVPGCGGAVFDAIPSRLVGLSDVAS